MKAPFDWYMLKDDPEMRITAIDAALERLLGGEGSDCTVGGTRCGTFPVVKADGDIVFCDDYGTGVFPSPGNISSVSLTEAVHSDVFARCRRETAARVKKNRQCVDCTVREICGGGCPRDWQGEANRLCEYHKCFYGYVSERIRSLLADVPRTCGLSQLHHPPDTVSLGE
jgi:radical SAM protein with 4Fe4S-binding SPASM domain